MAQGIGCGLSAVGCASFRQDITDVGSDRIEADAEDIRNLPVALTRSEEA